jgi:glutamate-ammonia-ligase adenylyltransferase
LDKLKRASPVMSEAICSHPEWLEWLRQRLEVPSTARELARDWDEWIVETGSPGDEMSALRAFARREYVEIALRDIAGHSSFEDTVTRLSRLAEWVISVALYAIQGELAVRMPEVVDLYRGGFAVIALGKLGGGELNYSSDIDLIFCRRASDDAREMRFFTRLGERLVHFLGQRGAQGFLYRVDMRLRPYGETGPLVPTIESLENYYESWGEAWERQALIKARPICGDEELGHRFQRFAETFVFARQTDDSSLEEIKRVKHRAEREYARLGGRIDIKHGAGGIRDIEFYVQYLQLIAGGRFPEVRLRSTLDAIHALSSTKTLLDGEESQLALAYVLQRTIEHRLQLRMLTAQVLVPERRSELEVLARGLGFGSLEHSAPQLSRAGSYDSGTDLSYPRSSSTAGKRGGVGAATQRTDAKRTRAQRSPAIQVQRY